MTDDETLQARAEEAVRLCNPHPSLSIIVYELARKAARTAIRLERERWAAPVDDDVLLMRKIMAARAAVDGHGWLAGEGDTSIDARRTLAAIKVHRYEQEARKL